VRHSVSVIHRIATILAVSRFTLEGVMAISFSRPDPSSPAAVGAASFPVSRRGFDQGEVRDFLRMVAAELARLQERERFLESEMRAMQTRGMSSPGQLDEETVTTLLGEEAARVLATARDASAQIRERAEESATRLVKDAAEDAARIRESATLEAQRIRDDATADAEAEIDMAKQQGRDMVNEAREYREKVLSELSRRRDAARGQIEQLLHGRDRLLSAFERARLASEDVINGLTEAHDEPEFIVNLAPVTGPVPVVNPEHPSNGIFDREQEQVVIEHDPVQQDIVEEDPVQKDIAEEDLVQQDIVEEDTVGKDLAVEHAVEDVASETVDVPDTAFEEVIEQEIAAVIEIVDELVDEISASEISDSKITDSEITEIEISDSDVADSEMSNVVSLFGRERPGPVLPEVSDGEISDGAVSQESISSVPERSVDSGKVDDIFARLRADSTAQVAEAATQALETATKTKKGDKAKSEKTQAAHVDPALFSQRDEALSSIVVQLSRKLKRILADEQNNVLEHLRKKKAVLEIEAMLGSVEEHAQRYCDAITDEMMKAATSGAKSMKVFGGSSRRISTKDLDEVVRVAISESLVVKFREDVRIAIGEAEGDRDILASLMRDVYRQWKMTSLDEHVDDIACAAFNCGAYFSLEAGSKVAWMISPTHGCCAECADNSLADDVTVGNDFPTGHRHPLAHAGCRCLVCPITH
jgi:DivIVA domain-containing protein